MTFCRSRAAAAKKWIKKRDLAIEFLFCLLKLRLIVFNFWCSRYRRRRGILNSVFILPKRLNHGINFLSPKYSLILNSWLLKLIIGYTWDQSILYLAYCIYTQLRTDGQTSSDMLSSRYYDGNRGVDDPFFIMHMNVIFLKSFVWYFSSVSNQLSTLRDRYVVETTVFCLKYSREVQFLLNFATIQCLLMKRNSNLLIA